MQPPGFVVTRRPQRLVHALRLDIFRACRHLMHSNRKGFKLKSRLFTVHSACVRGNKVN